MRALIVYESMFGSTRAVAEAIAIGLRSHGICAVATAGAVPATSLESAELLVVGAPTHVHGMPSSATRLEAARWAAEPARHLELEPAAADTGVREWLDGVEQVPTLVVAFDTRADIVRLISGSAAGKIERRLRRIAGEPIAAAESFLMRHDRLETGEIARAETWGRSVGAAAAARLSSIGRGSAA